MGECKLAISNMVVKDYDNRLIQNTFHDLRPPDIIRESPLDFGKLLELGLKFCIQKERPIRSSLGDTFSRFVRDVRLKFKFSRNNNNDPIDSDKKIYIKSSWQPKASFKQLE